MPNLFSRAIVGLIVVMLCVVPGRARAQARNGRLLVTVQDSTGGVLPTAVVTVTGIEDATSKATIAPIRATDRGLATFESLVPGRYSIKAEFPGFETLTLRDVRVRAGDNKQTITLALGRMQDSTTVGQDKQESASDRALTFGSVLTREQIEALSEDENELRNQLLNMAGDPTATIRVDSFEGQQLPPKAMIKSVRITRDQFSAENHAGGGIIIEIITQPGVGPLRGGARLGYYDSVFDGENPLVGATPPQQNRNLGGNLSGSLAKNKASFTLNVNDTDNYTTTPGYYNDGNGLIVTPGVKAPTAGRSFGGSLDYAVTKDQTLRTQVNLSSSHQDNVGVGGYNLPERAYSTQSKNGSFRIQEAGPLGRRFFTNTRFSYNWSQNTSRPAYEALAINVTDAFNSGGAQQNGTSRTQSMSLASDLDYVRGRHSFKAGVLLDGLSYRSNLSSNYIGTYVFESLDAHATGRPRSFTQRIGDPTIAYNNLQAGLFIQDDMRLRKNFTLTAGLRYEAQTHLNDYLNLGPRVGITWAPFKSGRTTIRTSWGIFYEWLSTGAYEQTVRSDGFHQRQVNIANPTFPDPGPVTALPADKYLLGDDLLMPRTMRLSLGLQQTLTPRIGVGWTYADSRGEDLFVGRNLNAPENGVRPTPLFVNVIEAISAGRGRQRSLTTNIGINLARASDAGNTHFFVPSRNLQATAGYTIGRAQNNTGGPFSLPATGRVEDDWGPSAEDVRHRLNFGIYTSAIRNFTASINFNAASGRPLNITTGYDDNGDLVLNDRPVGTSRNSARMAWQTNSNSYFSYSFALGKRTVASTGGVSITQVNGQLVANPGGGQSVPRYRLAITCEIQNLTNHANYGGYSGVMTSPFFLHPVTATGVRRVTFGANVSF